jgi:hypothetical protein
MSRSESTQPAPSFVAEGKPLPPQCGWPRTSPGLDTGRIMPPRPVKKQWVTVEEDRAERGQNPSRS